MLLMVIHAWKKGYRADGDDPRVIPEQGDELRCKGEPQCPDHQQKDGGHLHAEPEALLHPVIQPGTVVEAAHRLEALAESDHGGGAEGGDPLDHAHGGDGRVSVRHGGVVEADGGHAGQALPGQGRQPALDDELEVGPFQLDAGDVDVKGGAPGAARQQQTEPGELADDGGPGGARHSQVKDEDQQGIQPDVQHGAAGDADGAVDGVALEAQLVVQYQGGGHPRRADEDHAQVVLGIGQNGGGGAQERGQGRQEDLAENADEESGEQGGEKAGGRHVRGRIRIAPPQLPGDEVAAAVAEEKAHSLDHRHHGKHHAHSASGSVAAQHPHKKGLRHVVKSGHQHTDDAGNGQMGDHPAHRFFCELVECLFLFFTHGEPSS